MITKTQRDSIMQREAALKAYCVAQGFTNKRSGWTSYKPEQVAHLNPPTNEERSAVEVFDFCADPPDRYFVYVNPKAGTVTTWTGEKLGDCQLGQPYVCPAFGSASTRQPIRFKAINGRTYAGTFYRSSGDFARVKLCKS